MTSYAVWVGFESASQEQGDQVPPFSGLAWKKAIKPGCHSLEFFKTKTTFLILWVILLISTNVCVQRQQILPEVGAYFYASSHQNLRPDFYCSPEKYFWKTGHQVISTSWAHSATEVANLNMKLLCLQFTATFYTMISHSTNLSWCSTLPWCPLYRGTRHRPWFLRLLLFFTLLFTFLLFLIIHRKHCQGYRNDPKFSDR